MSHRVGNNCICSNCFVRSYEIYNLENRSVVWKKGGSIKPFKPRTAEEVERTFWKFYLQKLKIDRRNTTKFVCPRRPTKKVEELDVVRDIRASDVLVESPTNADGRQIIMEVDPKNFWDFVYQQAWNGRIRVCEGELMYKITETLKTLVSKKKIANFAVTRMFTAKGTEERNDTIRQKEPQSSALVVRVDQTYYGGVPRKTKKMVQFNLVPNSVFTPRLTCLSPILKRDKNATRQAAQMKCPTFFPSVKAISSSADKHKPTLKHNVRSRQKQEPIFRSCDTKDDFASMCFKATQDFIVTKELITNSKTLKSLKFFTLRRKDSLWGNNKISETMNDFYTSASLSDDSKKSPVLTPLLEMEI